jgi:glutamine amidotransferase
MGWNQLHASGSASQLIQGLDGKHAYFVHSFAVLEHQHALMQTDHGGRFTAVAGRENFYGAQFHPERSEQTGHQLLKNFLELA